MDTRSFIAAAFKEDFTLSELPTDWKPSSFTFDSKECKVKKVIGGGTMYAYSFGAVTFVDVGPIERQAELAALCSIMGIAPNAKVTTEEFSVEERPKEKSRVEFMKLIVSKITSEREAVVAQTIAQSASMEYYESLVKHSKNQVMALVSKMMDKGRVGSSPEKLYKDIAEAMIIRGEIIGVLHLLDKPEVIWEDKTMDALYSDLRAAFDLSDRFRALEHKLAYIQETLEVLAETVRDTRLVRLDVAILLVIVLEIAMSFFGWMK